MNSPTGQTRRRIFTLYDPHDADSRKDVPFGGIVDIAPHFRGEIPRKPQFWGVNRCFQAKRAKYRKFHVIETIFNQILHNDRDHQEVVVGGPKRRPSNPRWWTAAIKKTVKSPYLCNHLTDFDKIWYSDTYWPLTADLPLKFQIFEIQDGGGHHLEKSQKSRYFCNSLTDLYKICYADAEWVP